LLKAYKSRGTHKPLLFKGGEREREREGEGEGEGEGERAKPFPTLGHIE